MALGGWRIEGELPDAPRFVIVAAPHTSNWDFPIAILAMFGFGIRMSWLGKHTIFRFPVAALLRWMGGEPVDRSASKGLVEVAIERFRQRPQWVLGISPEGTRKWVREWKSGYYRIAIGAGVPIIPVRIDWQRRVLSMAPLFHPTTDPRADERALRQHFTRAMARYPDRYAETAEDACPVA